MNQHSGISLKKIKLDIKNEKSNIKDSIDSFKSIDNKITIFLGFYILMVVGFANFIFEHKELYKDCVNRTLIIILIISCIMSVVFLVLSILPRDIKTQIDFSDRDEIFNDEYSVSKFLEEYRKILKENIFNIEEVNKKKAILLRIAVSFLGVSIITYILILFL